MSILNHVISGKSFKPPRIIVYGPPKIGKSTFLSEMPKPIVIQTEDGNESIGTDRFPLCENLSDVFLYLKALRDDKHKFKTIGMDSLSALQTLIFQRVAEDKGKTYIEDIGFQAGYKLAIKYWEEFFALVDEVVGMKSMAFCGIAHATIREYHDPDGENYDQFTMDLHKHIVPEITRWADMIMFINFKTYTKVTGEGLNKEVKPTGDARRVAYTEKRAAFDAGRRDIFGALPSEFDIERGQTWNTIAKYLGEETKKYKTVKKEVVELEPKEMVSVSKEFDEDQIPG